ncbi:MAG: OmpH family outer membrane protein [Chitinophagales bacterium]
MRNGAIILNIVLLIAVGVLFYLQLNSGKKSPAGQNKVQQKEPVVNMTPGNCNIAYFEMDSVEANFEMARQWKNELEKKEDNINAQMNRLENTYQEKFASFQQKKPSMNNAQVEAATNELAQLDETIKNTKANLDQDYKTYYVQTQQEILSMIRKFCSAYNKDNRYAMIISDEPGIVFYKDSSFDITNDLLAGLNKMYGTKRTEKSKK